MTGAQGHGDALTAPAITIERLAAGGDGVGHLADGLTVFVPRTAPGDRVRLGDVVRHRRHAFARAAEIVEPGAGRVAPPCAHFSGEGCGGCQWQHLTGDAQRLAKARIVGDALRRIGRLDLPDPAVTPSPRAFG
jgi:23S rRNA (uracil1939-C5)-methyltransferase